MSMLKVVGFAVVGALLVLAAPAERAGHFRCATPAPPPRFRTQMTTEVRWHRWHHRRHWRRW